MRRWIRTNGDGEAVMSWKFFLGLLGILLMLLGWAARGGATTRQVEVNAVAIVEMREVFKEHERESRVARTKIDDKLDKLAIGQARIAARLGVDIDQGGVNDD